MTTFEKPVFELIKFDASDIITASVNPGGGCAHDACPRDCNNVCRDDCIIVN